MIRNNEVTDIMDGLTHTDDKGNAIMVDISDKDVTFRTARASGIIRMRKEALNAVLNGDVPKGDVLAAARIAGIMGCKNTSSLIPLCHPLSLTGVTIDFIPSVEESCIRCECSVRLSDKTGAEMEALTGVSIALLTIYDMCKAIDKGMVITDIRLEEKSGGKSGHYIREED